ncbi:alpha/beta fold hydrolase [Nocardia sp. FBN12]|uniref:alpha/beta fold hydrolase n=1 Tax=Nocardia sp. FBN12 TaxID=3419766 RepID=UPI003D001D04
MGELHTCKDECGRRLAWAEYGAPNGTPVVFFHGTPGGRLAVTHQDDFLSQQLRVIAPDRAGYGQTDPLPGRSVHDSAKDVLAILDACGFEQVLAVGGSGGGPHALALAAAAPDRVRAVGVFVGAAPLVPDEITDQSALNQSIMSRIDKPDDLRDLLVQVRTSLLEGGMSAIVADMPPSDREQWSQHIATRQRAIDDALAPGIQGMFDDYCAIFGDKWGFELSDVSSPVVWAHGDQDRNVPISAARRLADKIRHHRFINWTGVGHAPGPEKMSQFYAALVASSSGRDD